jgi:hypothetical protein
MFGEFATTKPESRIMLIVFPFENKGTHHGFFEDIERDG